MAEKHTVINKKTLIERLSEKQKKSKISKNEIKEIVSKFLEEINQALIKNEEIRLVGHFTLTTKIRSEGMAMNLQTGKKMKVAAKRVPKIKFSPVLKEAIAS